MSTTEQPGTPTGGGRSPWLWVAVGCGGLIVLTVVVGVILAVVVPYFAATAGRAVVSKVEQQASAVISKVMQEAGIDPEMWEQNPAEAATRMLAHIAPELEVVETDEENGTVTLRDKETGQETTISFTDIQQGRISIRGGEQDQTLTIEANPEGDEMQGTVTGGDVTTRFGTGDSILDEIPDWVPRYPGGKAAGGYSAASDDEASGMMQLTTSDSHADVVDHYRRYLESAGYQVAESSHRFEGQEITSLASSEGPDNRTLTVTVSTEEGGQTNIAIVYQLMRKR